MRAELASRLRIERQSAERRRNSMLALGALLLHAAVLLLLPGIAVSLPRPEQLRVTLIKPDQPEPLEIPPPAVDGDANQATAPVISPKVTQNDPRNKPNPARQAEGRPTQKPKPAAQSPTKSTGKQTSPGQAKGDVKQSAKGGGSPPKNPDATDVMAVSPAAVQSETPKTVKDQPKPAPSQKPSTSPKPSAQPADNSGEPGKARPSGGDSAGSSSSGTGQDSKPSPNKGQSNPGPAKAQPQPGGEGGASARPDKDGGSGPSTAPAEGPPAAPPGPTQAELDLLGAYGDACRKKIRQLVRTPEIALENKHKGKVTFEFTVSNRGKLEGVRVVKSGGHGELDAECKEATRVAGQSGFGPFPSAVAKKVTKWTFTMTLQFPIEGGY